MKKIFIYAYSEFNLGDDLFIKILCERYPKTLFYIYAPRKYKILFKDVNNLKVIPKDNMSIRIINYIARKILKRNNFFKEIFVRKSNGTVYIGGSLFIEEKNWGKYLESVSQMIVPNRPAFLLGANFGPYNDTDFYDMSKRIFNQFEDICFRDKKSYNLFQDLKNVRMADDIVFQLEKKNLYLNKSSKNVIISVIKPSYRKELKNEDEIYYLKMSEIARYLAEKGYTVTLMSFCEFEGDDEAVNKILSKIPAHLSTKVNNYNYKLNISEALNLIESSCFIVGTRFHSMILGWVFEKPVFPIVYSEKMTNVMNDIGFKGGFSLFSDLENLDPEIVFESMEKDLLDVSLQKSNAIYHFKILDELLNLKN